MAKTVTSVKRALEILELFLTGIDSISVPEITGRFNFPRTTAHELVQTLLTLGYLERVENQPYRFRLGMRVFQLGNVYAAQLDLTQEGQKVAKKVSDACDETVQIAILEGAEAVFIVREDSSQTLRLVSEVGSRLPAHCTGVGKMLLSELTHEQLASLYNHQDKLAGMTRNSITSLTELESALADIRKKGCAFDDCESNEDARCVAAPIFNRHGRICAAMSITVPRTRMNEKRRPSLEKTVQAGARELSRRLGYNPEISNHRDQEPS
ncbi:MAG: IclR family transcriptional regulator [Desulfotignum sp.]|nr:IclR family transcriptional regulator [Desulfotignum sp.]MCF8089498.1 IclR family transcriptional regulator [Desulfotignum sp.]